MLNCKLICVFDLEGCIYWNKTVYKISEGTVLSDQKERNLILLDRYACAKSFRNTK